jgi:glycosyltransferase involved in cell wall biosynthesis
VRILLQSMYYAPEVGGLESHVVTLCHELARRGHEVRVLTSRSRPGLPRRETRDGVEVRRVWLPARTPAGWIAHALASAPAHYRWARDVDVLHAQDFAAVPPAWPARWRYAHPLVLSLHTSHFLVRARRPAWRPVLRRIIASADAVFAASREILDVALGLAPHPRAEVLLNAVDTETFRPGPPARPGTPARRRVLVPRRLVPKNGVEYAIRAVPFLSPRVDAELWIVGDGPERARLERLADELGVRDRVRFLGARPHAEMPGVLRSAELVVIPSLMEASSVAALEAMACGVPVVASRAGGLPEVVDDAVGALVPPADPRALADAIAALLADPAGLRARGTEARRRVVERFSLGRLVDRHVEVYRELLEARRADAARAGRRRAEAAR